MAMYCRVLSPSFFIWAVLACSGFQALSIDIGFRALGGRISEKVGQNLILVV